MTSTEFISWSYESDVPFSREALETIVPPLPDYVLRAKSVVYLQEETEQHYILQVMGNRWKLTPGTSWASEKPRSRLAFIGVQEQFDPAELSLRLEDRTEETETQRRSK